MNKKEKIDQFCELLKENYISRHDIEHFKRNAKNHKLKKDEQYILKNTNALDNKGKVYQIWSTMNRGLNEFEYICCVYGHGYKKVFVFD